MDLGLMHGCSKRHSPSMSRPNNALGRTGLAQPARPPLASLGAGERKR